MLFRAQQSLNCPFYGVSEIENRVILFDCNYLQNSLKVRIWRYFRKSIDVSWKLANRAVFLHKIYLYYRSIYEYGNKKYSKFWRQIQIPKYSLANGSRPKDLMPKSSMHIWKDDGWLTYRKGYMHCKEPIQHCCMLSLPTISNFPRNVWSVLIQPLSFVATLIIFP